MKPRDTRFLKQWEVQRKGGRTRYVLLSGVLSWGVPMFVVMTFVVARPVVLTPDFVAISFAMYLAGGALLGYSVWAISERRYRKLGAHTANNDKVV